VIVTDRALGRLLNLIGGVLLLPLGRYYRLVPDAGASALAKAQAWLHIIGAIAFPIGIALVTTQGEKLVSVPHPGFAGRERAVVCSRRSCSDQQSLRPNPGPRHISGLIHGIVRGTDSPAPIGAKHVKKYA
jgi:hypothetical protein